MMKRNIRFLAIILLLASVTLSAQIKKEWGAKFDYDLKIEQEPKVVLADNYNHYLMTFVNKDGIMAQHQIIMRKFDQKNNLVDTFIQDFPEKTLFTLYNCLGSYELGKDKVVIFIDGYSNKTKKKSIHRMIFDKTTDKFTSTLIVDYTFESLSKSGTAYVVPSQNGNYYGIVYSKFSNKKIAEVDECTVIDAKTFDVVWKKTITFPVEFYSGDITVTNSGKLVFIKRVVSKSEKHALYVVDATSEADKDLGADIKLSRPVAITIGNQDYLIAFNLEARLREWSYSNIMLYDLQLGKIISNDKIDAFPGIKDPQDVRYNVNVHDNQIDLFAECKYQTGSKPSTGMFANDPKFNDPVFSFGSGIMISMSKEGKIMSSTYLLEKGTPYNNELVGFSGLLTYKGNYYVNTYAFNDKGREYAHFYQLVPPGFSKKTVIRFPFYYYDTDSRYGIENDSNDGEFRGGHYIHQFVNYFPDSKRLLFAKYFEDGKAAFVSYFGTTL
jgi:hypothetical protein